MRAAAIGLGVVIGAAAIVGGTARLDDAGTAQSAGPVPSLLPDAAGGSSTKLGIFEPIRGWIVYPIGNGLEAVSPADPGERHTLKLPDGLDALLGADRSGGNRRPSPAGWTADGRELALSNEYSGDHFVVNQEGAIETVDLGLGGCCAFVTEPWLSPDGRMGIASIGTNGIRYVELESGHHLVRKLDPPISNGREVSWQAAWSPSSMRIAFVTGRRNTGSEPALHVADFTTGANHSVADIDAGYIRHISWSPDESRILVVAGEPLDRSAYPGVNPLLFAQPTRLLLVDTDDSGVHAIASGYYVAAAWSPDGSRIAAIEYTRGRRLVVMNADGTGKRTLVELPTGELFTGLAWHPLPADG